MKYTVFKDMFSGGSQKEEWERICVTLPEEEAIEWFVEYFGHDPLEVTCECCGQDYDIVEIEDLSELANNPYVDSDNTKVFIV